MSVVEKVKATTIGELTPLIGKKVITRDKRIDVSLTENGQMHTIDNMCPHRERPLSEGTVSGEYIYCPLHDQKVDSSTGKVQEPDTGCAETYQVGIQDGDVLMCF